LNGKLTKAPRFTPESVPTFDPSTIRLFPIHVHVDSNGFVYVNLDASPEPEISWHAQYGQLDRQERLVNSGIDWNAVEYDFTWTKDGAFNWKVMQDNYNEVSTELFLSLSPYPPTPRLLLWSASLADIPRLIPGPVLPLSHRTPGRRQNHQFKHLLRLPQRIITRRLHRALQRAQGFFHPRVFKLRRHTLRWPLPNPRLPRRAILAQPGHRVYAPHALRADLRDDNAPGI
jgi:hypothetical protein